LVQAPNSCGGGLQKVTGDFPTWWTDNTSIATANKAKITGVGVGSTNHHAQSKPMYWGYREYGGGSCPLSQPIADAGTNVKPTITSFDPNPIMIGSTNQSLTINGSGFGTSPTVSLPSGFTSSGQGSTDTKIVLTGVSVAYSATVGNNNVTVTASGQTSPAAALGVDGPYHLIVEGDITFLCSGCNTTVERDVTYQIQNFSGSNAGVTWMGEDFNNGSSSCTPSNTGSPTTCSQNFQSLGTGIFIDQWSMSSDAYQPSGCGFTVNYDHWQWCRHSAPQTLGTLTGYIHTDHIKINGVLSPAQIPSGTVVPF
jgi:hypothetical protein